MLITISIFRKLVATRDIVCGELICLERPLNRGPKPSTRPVCLGCYLPLQSASALCPEGCGWPVCSEGCPLLQQEHNAECEHFRRCKFKVEVRTKIDFRNEAQKSQLISSIFRFDQASELKYGEVEPLYDIISPLRVLRSPPEAKEAFFGLESHLEKWKEEEGFVEGHKAIAEIMRDSLGFEDAEQVGVRRQHVSLKRPYLRNHARLFRS